MSHMCICILYVSEGGILTADNVMEYFYLSIFYTELGGPNSLNEMLRRGLRHGSDGDLFALVESGDGIFVIQKFSQKGQRKTNLETLYVICGTIFLAPCLGQLLEAHLTASIEQLELMIDNVASALA